MTALDESRAWAVGSDGLVIVTHDGGSSWQRSETPTSAILRGVTFADQDNGWVLAGQTELLTTADGGLTWQETAWNEGSVDWMVGAFSARNVGGDPGGVE